MSNQKELLEEVGKFIYPEVNIQRDNQRIKISTTLRKEHNGEWYNWEFMRYSQYNQITLDDLELELKELHREVYRVIIEGIVDPDCKEIGFGNEPLFKKSISQLSESERLKLKYKPSMFSTEGLPMLDKFIDHMDKVYGPTKESVLRSAEQDKLI